jgi:hypothetical protein
MNELLERLRAKRNELWSRKVDDCPEEVAFWNQNRMKANYAKCNGCGLGELMPTMECYADYCVAYNSGLSPYPEVPVDNADIQKCIEFSEKSDYGKSATRGASDIDKLKSDNVAGKTGEFVVRNTLRSLGVKAGEPDLDIYPPDRKSFDPDLSFIFNGCGNGISIKTFRIHPGKPSRVSWVIQRSERNGRGGRDRHFFDPDPSFRKDQWFAGVALSPDLAHGRILAFLPMQLLYDAPDSYGEMETRNGIIENTKRAIYWDDLRRLNLLPDRTGIPFGG